MNKYIKITYEKNLAILEIDNAPANVLSIEVLKNLSHALKELNNNKKVHAVILTGKGKFFVAGADIKEFIPNMGNKEAGKEMSQSGQAVCDEIEAMKKPVIAAINGLALGGGLEIALACHIRLISDTAEVGLPELKLGLLPSFGGTQRLTKIVGLSEAMDIILSSKQLTAKETKELKITKEIIPGDQLLNRAKELATTYVGTNSFESVTRVVEALVSGYNSDLSEGLKIENEKFAELFLTNDAKEGVEAFNEKRAANFKHS